jgi:DNA-binding transcriptional MocR family regulator
MRYAEDTSPRDPRTYMRIAAAIRDQITSGQLRPGHPGPSTTSCPRDHAIARDTSPAELLHIRDHQDHAAMSACEAQHGVLSEGTWDGGKRTLLRSASAAPRTALVTERIS